MPLSQYLDKKAGKRSCKAGHIIRKKTIIHTIKIYMIYKADTRGCFVCPLFEDHRLSNLNFEDFILTLRIYSAGTLPSRNY